MSSSARFGISIPKDLLIEIEEMAKKLNVSRSKLVEIALRSFLAYTNLMSLEEGQASVLMIIISKEKTLRDVLLKLKEVSNNLFIAFKGEKVIVVSLIEGDLKKIREVVEEVKKIRGCAFYPLVVEKTRTQ